LNNIFASSDAATFSYIDIALTFACYEKTFTSTGAAIGALTSEFNVTYTSVSSLFSIETQG
jgi:hypothetical protein